ncbi:SDR family oxidoreductase [Novosphingobium sp. ERN07]|uniref:SDR family NAD(P)-dependent oxidoreductase n=1 Tax=unclassified Novosphingobium TaxID=2644732 RepID=UPI001456AD8D|nr:MULTISPECIES: SDR family oxidoreductase [unclassified Novosphingobium]NLR41610.1 SDR family oxidoreductase [Novosphingobium sp. ERW19]NLR73298.1 SDR family oxidoreductase [Novosphingobium sp. ERN07]
MFEGRTVLVVGSTGGIGEAVYRLCREQGATVIGTGRRLEEGERIAAEAGGRFEPLDITDDAAVIAFFAELAREGVVLDGAVNNAAMTQDAAPLDSLDLALFDRLFALNVRGVFHCLKHQMAAMRGRGGSIVNVASIAGQRGFPGLALYSASKHAVVGLTRSSALDGAADAIRVNAVLPGTTRTEMFDQQMLTRPGGEASTVARIPLGRVSAPHEQAQAIAWLLSDQSSFVTGETLAVDGGTTVR